MTTQGPEAGPIANNYGLMGPNSPHGGVDDMLSFQNYEERLMNLEEINRSHMTAQQGDDGMAMPRRPNQDPIPSPACYRTTLESFQYLGGHPATPQNYSLPMGGFERTEHGIAASDHSYFPQMSSCLSRTKDSVSIQESSESEGDISNPQNCSTLSWPQAHAGLQLQDRHSSPLRISQDGGRQGVASQTPQKPAIARKRTRKVQQLNCPSCAKIFSRPCDLKKHSRTHERTFMCSINGCTNTQGFGLHKDLRRHIDTVHLRATFTCHFASCGETFSRSDNCLRHFEEQHV
ncbi:hypothetical protein BGZ57DRAFT_930047 [Hyaloscypha finlandica]|nr:hypothetical protein BGZ57DRAFT_930047 [Hyaloscypha finlandica]